MTTPIHAMQAAALEALEEVIPPHLRTNRHGANFMGERYEKIRAALAALDAGEPHCRVQAIELTDAQRAMLTSTASEIPGVASPVAAAPQPVKWTGADGESHEITLDYAAQIAKWVFDTYGDVPQVDAAIAAAPQADAMDAAWNEQAERIEKKAREIYDGWKDMQGWVPWVEGGNSHTQDDARRIAAFGERGASPTLNEQGKEA